MPPPTNAYKPYADAHAHLAGPGDARPTALRVLADQNLLSETYAAKGKTYLVTGGAGGIGKETARALHATGADVFLTVREGPRAAEQGAAAIQDILQAERNAPDLGCPIKGRLEVVAMDLSRFDSVRRGAKDFLERSTRLDGLVLNAGVCMCPASETAEGWEMHMGTNHFAHFLLFRLLEERLLASIATSAEQSVRVVVVSSAAHRFSKIRWDDMNFKKDAYDAQKAYGQSKLANIYMASSIDRLYGPRGLRAVSVHPGVIMETSAGRHSSAEVIDRITQTVGPMMKSTSQGAATQVWAATSTHFINHGGVYLADVGEVSNVFTDKSLGGSVGYTIYAYDEAEEDKLWNLSCEVVGA